ncbi:hypothetical protein QTI66_12000 [Variovorax sp. J22R133]|uniref:hypothetical protein n=1 Tax=Variovorax brevis TaxID=3053503 RepID=UPI0025777A39|nr:hypothetical protein [Variovorax sp. J22R133]MDM0112874.1 hypothetical protein [Variovorax sp. J22R133]
MKPNLSEDEGVRHVQPGGDEPPPEPVPGQDDPNPQPVNPPGPSTEDDPPAHQQPQ